MSLNSHFLLKYYDSSSVFLPAQHFPHQSTRIHNLAKPQARNADTSKLLDTQHEPQLHISGFTRPGPSLPFCQGIREPGDLIASGAWSWELITIIKVPTCSQSLSVFGWDC